MNPRPEGVAGEVFPRVVKGGSAHQFGSPDIRNLLLCARSGGIIPP